MATALYRRYRPESFADVIGQEHVTEPLMQALRTGRVGHAYLFSGPRGCGKTTSARILARCLNCERGPTPTPCGTCDSCVALARGGPGSVDVIEIDAASHGGVDDARDLRERASYGPAQSRYKVYIIDEAHMVTTQGFNALLKIVEEPPEHVKFVFATTEPEKVIGTIRSRTHHYPFRLVPPAKLIAYLERILEQEGVAVEPGVLSFVSRAGGGSVRDSLSVLDQLIAGSGPEGLTYAGTVSLLGFTDAELLDATIDALAAGDGAATFRQVDKVIESGHDPRRFVEDLLERLRDLIVVAAVRDGAGQVLRGVPEDQLERMRVQQAAFGPAALSRAADIVNTGLTEMTGATSPRLQLELICARVLLPAASGEQGYAARLDRIERRLEVGGAPTSFDPPRGRPVRPGPSGPTSSEPSRGQPAPVLAATPEPSVGRPAPGPEPAREPPRGRPAPAPAAVPEPSRGQPPAAAPASASSPTTATGTGLDTDAIRRAWPDVLGRVFQMRRITWTFVSQNAQVVGYDGRTLTLGIATEGLTNTFRAGNHAEIVRQALIDELGLDARVEGVHLSNGGPALQSPPRSPSAGGPAMPGPDSSAPDGDPAARPRPSPPRPSQASPSPPHPPSRGDARASRVIGGDVIVDAGLTPTPASRSLDDNASWGSVTAPPPDWAAEPLAAEPLAAEPTTDVSTGPRPNGSPGTPEGPGPVKSSRTAAAREPAPGPTGSGAFPVTTDGSASSADGSASSADDSAASADDEDIEISTDVGRAVIEKVLGGTVLQELDE
ncbi:MAG: DNA polymerase III subunit gamma and tau [Intrasporangium sp.]|uniref:DNA polymerase III subunit gamma and tau n=1 Tax=Intrasporangium sp. TaxID=1925024 RepID=UPI0026497F24|nr:DNA polymerase III subunit gamma and tau [Intrasporangium sp.]MDN5796523.1 DNA polymerase III subunit gamma and tau [Intrasporangium sp.]